MTWLLAALVSMLAAAPAGGAKPASGAKIAPVARPDTIICAGPHVCPACQVGRCDNLSQEWVCDGLSPAGTTCDDGIACTFNDHCDGAGACVGTSHPCTPTNCQLTSACDSNGGCTTTPKSDGAACEDGDACTGAIGTPDHCVSGACTAGTSTVCTTPGTCQTTAGATCNHVLGQATSGKCTYPTAANNTPCNDNAACTKNDVCTNGTCAGTTYSCAAPGTCQTGGACDGSGGCTYSNKANGTPCDDSNALTTGETCSSGVCGNPTGCTGGAVFCNGVCTSLASGGCCADSDCLVSGNEGRQVCVNHLCTGAPTCADGFFACGATCLPKGACCTAADCPTPFSCVNNACSLGCATGMVACGNSCVQTGALVCCPSDNN